MPRVPMLAHFPEYVRIGRELADLHLMYEKPVSAEELGVIVEMRKEDYNHSQKLLSFRYNIDTNRVEARFTDGSAVANRMPNCLRTSSTRYFTVGLTRRIECHRFFMATAENHCNVFCVTNWSSE